VSTITAIDTGLSYVATASSKSNIISLSASRLVGLPDPGVLRAGYEGLLDRRRPEGSAVRKRAGNTNHATGTYYGVLKNRPLRQRVSHRQLPERASHPAGFPHG